MTSSSHSSLSSVASSNRLSSLCFSGLSSHNRTVHYSSMYRFFFFLSLFRTFSLSYSSYPSFIHPLIPLSDRHSRYSSAIHFIQPSLPLFIHLSLYPAASLIIHPLTPLSSRPSHYSSVWPTFVSCSWRWSGRSAGVASPRWRWAGWGRATRGWAGATSSFQVRKIQPIGGGREEGKGKGRGRENKGERGREGAVIPGEKRKQTSR